MKYRLKSLNALVKSFFGLALLLIFTAGNPGIAAEAEPQAKLPQVTFKTDVGNITLELFADKAPATVANFLRYCREGFYVGTIFHRVIPGFVVQGGGLTFDYMKKETHEPVVNEASNGLRNRRGTVAMARLTEPDSATSQFYINLNHNKHLDPGKDKPGYTVFGHVIEGMDVVQQITAEPQGKYRDQAPDLPVRILSVSVQ